MGEWPAQRTVRGSEELEEAMEEGIVFHPLRGVRRFLGTDGKLTGVELAEVVQLTDAEGNYAPRYGAHVAEVIACDAAFLAVGQTPELAYLAGTPDLRRTPRGLIEANPETLATSVGRRLRWGRRGVWSPHAHRGRPRRQARRAQHPASTSPVAERMRSATSSKRHPRGQPPAPPTTTVSAGARPPCARWLDARASPRSNSALIREEAQRQADRCLICHVQTVYDGDLCIACGRCTEVCPYGCLSFVDAGDAGGGEHGGGSPACIRCTHAEGRDPVHPLRSLRRALSDGCDDHGERSAWKSEPPHEAPGPGPLAPRRAARGGHGDRRRRLRGHRGHLDPLVGPQGALRALAPAQDRQAGSLPRRSHLPARAPHLLLIREGNTFRALSAVCTHLGCTVGRADEGYHCPCHGSFFSEEGTNVAGPAPRPLPWRKLDTAGDGSLVVDLSAEVEAETQHVLSDAPNGNNLPG